MTEPIQHRCPITYVILDKSNRYSTQGLRMLSSKLTDLQPLPLSAEELRYEARKHADKMSIQGVQAKLSAILDVKHQVFTIVDQLGDYILKPPSELCSELPQNEDLTMRMAASVKIPVPIHGLIYNKDLSFTYFIKRFDRGTKHKKYSCEDFAQLSNHTRETKYNFSMEKIIQIIENFCTFPEVEKKQLFIRVLFNYLVGNEDMHLKNFSLITNKNITQQTPAYDYLNSTIVLSVAREEIALSLRGKKNNITRGDLMEYYAKTRLGLNDVIIQNILENFQSQFANWRQLIHASFLSEKMKQAYLQLVSQRIENLKL